MERDFQIAASRFQGWLNCQPPIVLSAKCPKIAVIKKPAIINRRSCAIHTRIKNPQKWQRKAANVFAWKWLKLQSNYQSWCRLISHRAANHCRTKHKRKKEKNIKTYWLIFKQRPEGRPRSQLRCTVSGCPNVFCWMGFVKPILGSHTLQNWNLINFTKPFLHDITQPAPSDTIVSLTSQLLFCFTYYAKGRLLLLQPYLINPLFG